MSEQLKGEQEAPRTKTPTSEILSVSAMSERKSVNKHIDEKQQEIELRQKKQFKAKLKKQGLTTQDLKYEFHKQNKIRLMNPLPIVCLSCGAYIPKYRKFNGYKREVNKQREFGQDQGAGEYLAKIKVFELKFKCFLCGGDIVIRTDPLKAAAIGDNDYLFEDGQGIGDNSKKEDGFVVIAGAKKLEEESGGKTGNEVDRILENINREERLEEKRILDSVDKSGGVEQQLASMQKQQKDDEELEQLQRKELLKKQLMEKMKQDSRSTAPQERPTSLDVLHQKVEVIKMVAKPKKGKKKKIVKL